MSADTRDLPSADWPRALGGDNLPDRLGLRYLHYLHQAKKIKVGNWLLSGAIAFLVGERNRLIKIKGQLDVALRRLNIQISQLRLLSADTTQREEIDARRLLRGISGQGFVCYACGRDKGQPAGDRSHAPWMDPSMYEVGWEMTVHGQQVKICERCFRRIQEAERFEYERRNKQTVARLDYASMLDAEDLKEMA